MPDKLSRRSVLLGGGSLGLAAVGGLAVWQIASPGTTSAGASRSDSPSVTPSAAPTTSAIASPVPIAATTVAPPPSSASQPPPMKVNVNTALITSYLTVPYDLSSVGGSRNGQLRNAYCDEVDIASGVVLHRWSAIDHVPLSDSYMEVPTSADAPYDYFHMNSISITPDDQLLISSRHTCALYKIDRTTGQVIWTLGGKSSSFAVAKDAVFGLQHHAVYEDEDTIRLFDDGSGVSYWHDSRVIWIRPDTRAHTVALADSMTIPGISTSAMGSAQRLANGNVFVSWGIVPRLSEFSPSGEVLFDATLASPSYRGFKFQVY